MTKREKLSKMSLYDLLMLISDGVSSADCVIEAIESRDYFDGKHLTDCVSGRPIGCDKCIQMYLNEGE